MEENAGNSWVFLHKLSGSYRYVLDFKNREYVVYSQCTETDMLKRRFRVERNITEASNHHSRFTTQTLSCDQIHQAITIFLKGKFDLYFIFRNTTNLKQIF